MSDNDEQDDIAFSLAVFQPDSANPVQVRIDREGQTLWATVSAAAKAFDCTEQNVNQHIQNIYKEEVLDRAATSKKCLIVANEGSRTVRRQIDHYNLEMILAVGFRVSSARAITFQRWAFSTLTEFLMHGFVVDEKRLAQDPEAVQRLAAAIRRTRLSEQSAYQKVRDVFKMAASDYDSDSPAARTFFAMSQDKCHYAVTGKTAAEIIIERADATQPNMGLVTFDGNRPTLQDARIAKNYLTEQELHFLENISEQWMLFCESQAMRGRRMTMEELSFRLNTMLTANEYPVLYEYKEYLRGKADDHAKKQLDSYRALPPALGRT